MPDGDEAPFAPLCGLSWSMNRKSSGNGPFECFVHVAPFYFHLFPSLPRSQRTNENVTRNARRDLPPSLPRNACMAERRD